MMVTVTHGQRLGSRRGQRPRAMTCGQVSGKSRGTTQGQGPAVGGGCGGFESAPGVEGLLRLFLQRGLWGAALPGRGCRDWVAPGLFRADT